MNDEVKRGFGGKLEDWSNESLEELKQNIEQELKRRNTNE